LRSIYFHGNISIWPKNILTNLNGSVKNCNSRGEMDNTKKPIFIYSQELEKYSYPPESMFVTQRATKTRELLRSLGLLEGRCGREAAPVPATISEMNKYHSARYLKALQQAADGKLTREGGSMGLGTPDCPVFKDMFDYATWACGATLTGAGGRTDIVR
jgi:acetoin utilization protein AcuC